MRIHSIVLVAAWLGCAGCIAAGYLMAGAWVIIPILLGLAFLCFFAGRASRPRGASTMLIGVVSVAAFGVTAGLSFSLMLTGTVIALASWDLLLLGGDLDRVEKGDGNSRWEVDHLRLLAIALVVGWILATLSLAVRLTLPFIVAALMAVFSVGGLIFGLEGLKGRGS
jgi:hypothetical protein